MGLEQALQEDDPILVIDYKDKEEGFCGWLVIDGLDYQLSAGGMRVQPGLTRDHLVEMARNMTCKMRICGLPIAGAKCGIDYDPSSPGKKAAMARFLKAIKPYITSNYSMGPDLNTCMAELESIASTLDIPSVKIAIAKAQQIPQETFLKRYNILNEKVLEGLKLGKIRAGYGVSMACLAVLKHLQFSPAKAVIAVQGFGNLAKATIIGLKESGVTISAIADSEKCFSSTSPSGLNLDALLQHKGTLLPDRNLVGDPDIVQESREAIYSKQCDLLVLAAVENVVSESNAHLIKAKAVVPGANLAVTDSGEKALFEKGIISLPSFLAGCGGSMSMNGLFGPSTPPSAREVLAYIEKAMTKAVNDVLSYSTTHNIPPMEAAHAICSSIKIPPRKYPYFVDPAY